jgi:hypothetical protein
MRKIKLQERQPIWIALSDFYLDTELQANDFKQIASKIKESQYSLEEVKAINKTEVFPVLYANLLSVAGVWSGFEEQWLLAEIIKNLENKNHFLTLRVKFRYATMKWMLVDYWTKVESAYKEL